MTEKDKSTLLLESRKLTYDASKHLTTLSTGSIVLLTTFKDKLFPDPQNKGLLAVAFFGFILSIVASVIFMIMMAVAVKKAEDFDEDLSSLSRKSLLVSFFAFLVGIISLFIFALLNLKL